MPLDAFYLDTLIVMLDASIISFSLRRAGWLPARVNYFTNISLYYYDGEEYFHAFIRADIIYRDDIA